jgi:conflict system pore-forming effector with SLATT domain
MSDRHQQFLNLYHAHRHKEQTGWYEGRCAEFERARRQAIYTAGILMLLTTITSIFATTGLLLPTWVWATLSVFFPAISTALTAYNSLFAFEQQLKLYKDAYRGLHRAEADAYKAQKSADEADYHKKIEAYVSQVEEIFRKERGQWGQLISEIKPVDPPRPASEQE